MAARAVRVSTDPITAAGEQGRAGGVSCSRGGRPACCSSECGASGGSSHELVVGQASSACVGASPELTAAEGGEGEGAAAGEEAAGDCVDSSGAPSANHLAERAQDAWQQAREWQQARRLSNEGSEQARDEQAKPQGAKVALKKPRTALRLDEIDSPPASPDAATSTEGGGAHTTPRSLPAAGSFSAGSPSRRGGGSSRRKSGSRKVFALGGGGKGSDKTIGGGAGTPTPASRRLMASRDVAKDLTQAIIV